ncbi:MAG: MATE family efflux transporter [Oleispira antarctica]|uniref:Multidrug-efflux transporter n=1 Tax=Oleispira antarctica RB-8 TaxID=698738 RepID=R4YSS6_OLEAN|nr:MATE family efflux transporter [Oleispira antarctica]MBQ0791484.1 MATE family efflux transporter [Oleispira antarctica]CCK78015.1 Na+-driven multidrug efflux pump [Oleispira antarctica RB-8]|tara:strand:- start:6121 stop:7464 length:1344 start_codon:yes stop_codon:yes gene_type:complete
MLQLQKRILQLAWPIMLSNITVPLLSLVDTAVLGHLSEVSYLGGVALGGQVVTLLLWSFGFLRMGTTSLSAHATGASLAGGSNDQGSLERVLHNGLLMALFISLPLMLFAFLALENIIAFIGGSETVQILAVEYASIRLGATPAVLIQYVLIGWFIGRGETKVPLILLIASNSLNALLDVILVYGYGLTSDGVAWATLCADYFAASLGLYWAYRTVTQGQKNNRWSFNWPSWQELKPLININHQLFVRTLCLLSVFIFFTAQGAQQGDLVLAVNAIMLTLLLLISNALDGFAHAAESLVGQSLGAKNFRQLRQSIWLTGTNALIIALIMVAGFAWQGENLLGLLTDQQDVLTVAIEYSPWLIWLPLIGCSSYWLDGIFIGMQASAPMRNAMLLAAIIVFLPVWFLTQELANHGLWLAFYSFLLARSLFMVPAFLTILNKHQIFVGKN